MFSFSRRNRFNPRRVHMAETETIAIFIPSVEHSIFGLVEGRTVATSLVIDAMIGGRGVEWWGCISGTLALKALKYLCIAHRFFQFLFEAAIRCVPVSTIQNRITLSTPINNFKLIKNTYTLNIWEIMQHFNLALFYFFVLQNYTGYLLSIILPYEYTWVLLVIIFIISHEQTHLDIARDFHVPKMFLHFSVSFLVSDMI